MTATRHIVVIFMIVLVLPWGAALRWAEARTANDPTTVQAVAASHQLNPVARATTASHSCRTATLPGAPCFHAMLPGQTALAAPDQSPAPIRPHTARVAARFADAPDTGPPRFL